MVDRELRTDIMINIGTYIPLFTGWEEHTEQATGGSMWVRVGVIFRPVKTIFQIDGKGAKS